MKEVLTVIVVAEVIGVTIGIFNTIMTLHYTKKAEHRDITSRKASTSTLDRLQRMCLDLDTRLRKLEEKENKEEKKGDNRMTTTQEHLEAARDYALKETPPQIQVGRMNGKSQSVLKL